MLNPNEQIEQPQAKIAEKHGSNDKLDLWLVGHWERQITILKEQLKSEDSTR